MDLFVVFNDLIKRNINKGNKRFVIYPFGRNGIYLKELLNWRYGIQEEFIIDNDLSKYNSNIFNINKVKEMDCTGLIFVITSEIPEILETIKGVVKEVQIDYPFVREIPKSVKPIQYTQIGRYCYGPLANDRVEIEKIGSFCSFGPGSDALWNHPKNFVTTHEFMYNSVHCPDITNQKYSWSGINKRYVIGNDVWLGANVLLTNGINIGNGVIAGAGSIITKDVPDYAVVVGNPARIIRYRFTEEQIKQLNEVKWWDWPIEKIQECYDDFEDIEVFLKKHYKTK